MQFAMPIASLFAKPVVTVGPQTPLRTAASLMREHNVGALVVVSADRPVGIITDRDIALALCERGFAVSEPVQQVMTCPVETLRTQDGLYEAARRMIELGVRRLPVVRDNGGLAGLVSLDDVLLMLSRTLNQMAEGIHPAPAVEIPSSAPVDRPAGAGPQRRR
jgi:CBS domain-containing protein